MVDMITHKQMTVHNEGEAGPYIMVAVDQLEPIRTLLNEHRIRYWVDEDAISLDGKPEVTVINFGSSIDAGRLQQILDQVP